MIHFLNIECLTLLMLTTSIAVEREKKKKNLDNSKLSVQCELRRAKIKQVDEYHRQRSDHTHFLAISMFFVSIETVYLGISNMRT